MRCRLVIISPFSWIFIKRWWNENCYFSDCVSLYGVFTGVVAVASSVPAVGSVSLVEAAQKLDIPENYIAAIENSDFANLKFLKFLGLFSVLGDTNIVNNSPHLLNAFGNVSLMKILRWSEFEIHMHLTRSDMEADAQATLRDVAKCSTWTFK